MRRNTCPSGKDERCWPLSAVCCSPPEPHGCKPQPCCLIHLLCLTSSCGSFCFARPNFWFLPPFEMSLRPFRAYLHRPPPSPPFAPQSQMRSLQKKESQIWPPLQIPPDLSPGVARPPQKKRTAPPARRTGLLRLQGVWMGQLLLSKQSQ